MRGRTITLSIIIVTLIVSNVFAIWNLKNRTDERNSARELTQLLLDQGAQAQRDMQAAIIAERKKGFCI